MPWSLTLFFYQLVLVALVWLCVMLHWAWPSDPRRVPDDTGAHTPTAQAPVVSRNPLRASPQSRTATPVSTPPPPAHTPLQLHHRASS